MAWSFEEPYTARLTVNLDGSNTQYTLYGIANEDSITPAVAKTQLDKIFDIVGESVKMAGMKKAVIYEAVIDE